MAHVPLRKLLKKKRKNPYQLGKALKREPGTIYRWLQPDWNPRLSTLNEVAAFLKMRVRDMIED